MPPEIRQIKRQILLQTWLREGRAFTAREAARRLGVSRRTIAADFAALRRRGVVFDYNAERGCYELTEPGADLPLAVFSRRDFAALVVAQHALEVAGGEPQAEVLAGVVDRLAELLPDTVRVAPQAITARLRLAQGQPATARRPRFQVALHDAIEARRVVALRYRSASKAEVTERRVEPLALVEHQGRWYLVAYCHLRDGLRDFRLDRIEALEATCAQAVPRAFDLDVYLEGSFGMHRGERAYSVHLRFSAYQSRWIAEEQWHPTQVVTRLSDGRLDLRMQAQGLADLTRWVLSYGSEVEVLAPQVLRLRVRTALREALAQYADGGPNGADSAMP